MGDLVNMVPRDGIATGTIGRRGAALRAQRPPARQENATGRKGTYDTAERYHGDEWVEVERVGQAVLFRNPMFPEVEFVQWDDGSWMMKDGDRITKLMLGEREWTFTSKLRA